MKDDPTTPSGAAAATIFHAALDLPDPAERSRYLDQACGNNVQLREQVRQLLEADAQAQDYFACPVE